MHNNKAAHLRSSVKSQPEGRPRVCDGTAFKRTARRAMAGLLLAFAGATGAQTAPIGDVEFVRGAGAAQRPGEAARVLGAGSKVEQGDPYFAYQWIC